MLWPSAASCPLGDELRDEVELFVLVERLVEHQLEDRLRVGREALVRVPRRHVARPSDGDAVLGLRECDVADRACSRRRRGRASMPFCDRYVMIVPRPFWLDNYLKPKILDGCPQLRGGPPVLNLSAATPHSFGAKAAQPTSRVRFIGKCVLRPGERRKFVEMPAQLLPHRRLHRRVERRDAVERDLVADDVVGRRQHPAPRAACGK